MQKKQLSKEEALQKLRHYCAYQERSHREVKEKLYSFGLYKQQVEESISLLIEEDFLNEERYARSFARGHFRSKQWGRIKISYELKQKGVSPYCIQKAMKEIEEEDYLETLRALVLKKAESLEKEKNKYAFRQKVAVYCQQKGFEFPLIQAELARLGSTEESD